MAEREVVAFHRAVDHGDAVVAVFNVSNEERRIDLAVGSVGPILLDAASGEELAVTEGELRNLVLPARSGRALAVPLPGA